MDKQFYRKGNCVFKGEHCQRFDSINAAKRESRQLQKTGWKFKRPEGVTK